MAGKHSEHSSTMTKVCLKCGHPWCSSCTSGIACPLCKSHKTEFVHRQAERQKSADYAEDRMARSRRTQVNPGGGTGSLADNVLSTLIGVGLLVSVFFIFVGGFIPAMLLSTVFFYANKFYLSGKKTESQSLAHGWSALAQLSLYIAGYFVVKKVLFNMETNGMFDSFSTYKKIGSWDAMFSAFYFCAFPMTSFYFLKIGDHLSEVTGQPDNSAKVTFPRRVYVTAATILTLSLYHPWVSFKKEKDIWFVASLLHILVPLISIILLTRAGIEAGAYSRNAVEWSFVISLGLSIIHVNWIQREYLSNSQSQTNSQVNGKPKEDDGSYHKNGNSTEQEVPSGSFKKSHDIDSESPKWDSTDPFAILGITASATEIEIKEAYHKLIAQWHPDKLSALAPELQKMAEDKSKIINWAYNECLKERAA